jgi:hypothetical protein
MWFLHNARLQVGCGRICFYSWLLGKTGNGLPCGAVPPPGPIIGNHVPRSAIPNLFPIVREGTAIHASEVITLGRKRSQTARHVAAAYGSCGATATGTFVAGATVATAGALTTASGDDSLPLGVALESPQAVSSSSSAREAINVRRVMIGGIPQT